MNKTQLIVAYCRKIRFLCCALLISLFAIPFLCLAEINKETLKEAGEAMQGLVNAWVDNYKEMSKYHKPYYTYDNTIFQGVVYVAGENDNGNIMVIFGLKNNTKHSIDISKNKYLGVDNNGNIFRFEFAGVIENEGVVGSSVVNPKQEITFRCFTPFSSLDKFKLQYIQEIYIKFGGKRIFFVLEEKINEYKKLENRILRHLKNFWWNIR